MLPRNEAGEHARLRGCLPPEMSDASRVRRRRQGSQTVVLDPLASRRDGSNRSGDTPAVEELLGWRLSRDTSQGEPTVVDPLGTTADTPGPKSNTPTTRSGGMRLAFDDQGEFRYALDADHEARLTVESGDSVTVETEDAYLGQISEPGDRRDREAEPRSNPLSGPIAVAGATPGDTLLVHVEAIEPLRGQASTYVPSWWAFLPSLAARETMEQFLGVEGANPAAVLPIEDGAVRVGADGDHTLPYEPMVGTVATAPAGGVRDHGTAGPHGGNMDLRCVRPGSTVSLPVNREGAHLYLGDAHACQGDGEITFVAGEMAAAVTVTLELLRGGAPDWPRIETADHVWTAVGADAYSTVSDAIRLAYVELATELVDRAGVDRREAWQLCALAGELRVGNPHCVAAGFPTAEL